MVRTTFVILCLCAASSPATAADTPALLKNPDMTLREGKPTGWKYCDFRTGGKAVVSADAGRQGSCAVAVRVATPQQRGAWIQGIKLAGQRFLKVQGWYRTEGLSPARNNGATVRMSYRHGDKQFWGDHRHYLEPSSEWKAFALIDDVIGEPKVVEVELFNFFVPGTVWFDDVTCTQATPEEWAESASKRLDKPPATQQVGYAPAEGEVLTFTPPAFRCVPVRGVKSYLFQCSPKSDFPLGDTRTYESDLCIYTPHETLPAGQWWWRYGFRFGRATVWSRVRSFSIEPEPMEFPRPRSEEAAALIPKTRPRVYFTPELLARVRKGEPEDLRNMVASVVRGTKRRFGQPLYPEPPRLPKDRTARRNSYQEIFSTMRPFTSHMETCALAYVLTGEKRFGDEAKRWLMHFVSWDPKGSTSVSHNDEPAMDLAMRGPRTFDWICDTLSPDEVKKCVEVFGVRLGEINRMHRRMPFETHPYSSHPGRMVPFVVEGSIVFYHEIPEAKEWLEYTLHLMWNTYPAWGSADGGWHEGPGYWGAYIGMMSRNVCGFGQLGQKWKRKPFFQNTGYFGLYAVPAYARQAPFGDGHEGRASRGHASILYGLASLHDNAYFRWYAEVQGVRQMYGPERFMAYRPELKPKPPVDVPQARCFDNIGVVGMHSNLADPTGSVQMLFKSDPYGSISHNHASQNAFAINAFGEALAISSGYYQQYGCPHHAQWTWETKAHNSLTIDGKGQRTRSRDSNGYIARFFNDDDITYVMGDATQAYEGRLKRFHRHVAFLRPDVFVMVDDIEAAKPVSAEWRLHARTKMALDPAKAAATITAGDARLVTRFLVPSGLRFEQTGQFPVAPHKPDSPNQWHLTVTPAEKSAGPVFVTVLRAYRQAHSAEPFQVRTVKVNGFYGAEIGRRTGRALAAIRTASAAGREVSVSGTLTDAEAIMIRRGADWKALTSFVASRATRLELADCVLLRSDHPVSVSGQYGGREARLVIEADAPAKCALHMPAAYPEPALPQGVQVVSRSKDTVELAVAAGRHEVVFPLAKAPAVAAVTVTGAGLKEPIAMAPTVGSHVTAWLAHADGMADGLHQAEVKYAAAKGSRLILTAGQQRHEWTAPGGAAQERFPWTLLGKEFPLVLINEHGLDPRARVESILFGDVTSAAKLAPAEAKGDGVIRIEAEKLASHRGLAECTRFDKYVCSGGILYGIGDLVTRVDYDVIVPKPGAYSIVFKHASDRSRTALGLEVNGECPCPAAELFVFQRTGGWGYEKNQWRVQRLCDAAGRPVQIKLSAGPNRLTLLGRGGRMHLDWIALVPVR